MSARFFCALREEESFLAATNWVEVERCLAWRYEGIIFTKVDDGATKAREFKVRSGIRKKQTNKK